MCGRYTLINLAALTDLFPWIAGLPDPPLRLPPRYNIAQSQPIPAIANDDPDHVQLFRWGLVPFWAKDITIGNSLCNARAETLADKGTFKHALKRRRCLIPADGFYEWKKLDKKTKHPMYIRRKGAKPFAFAGLWEEWNSPDGSPLRTATIITTRPNDLMAQIHDRMPAILRPEFFQKWIDKNELPPDQLTQFLAPYPADDMEAYPISSRVNSPKNDAEDLIAKVDPAAPSNPTTLFG